MTNIDKAAPGVEIEIGGKKRKLVFDMWAFYLLEKETGKNAISGEIFTKPSATDIIVLIWAALQHEEKISLEAVGRMMSLTNLPVVTAAIQKAFDQVAIPVDALKKSQADVEQPSEAQPEKTE